MSSRAVKTVRSVACISDCGAYHLRSCVVAVSQRGSNRVEGVMRLDIQSRS